MTRAWWLATVALAGCHSFEDPNIVVDLRVLSMSAADPQQVVDVDLTQPLRPTDVLGQLHDTEVCSLVVDPNFDRRLRYTLTLCSYSFEGRCDGDVDVPLGSGLLDDPDLTPMAPPQLCAHVAANGNLLGVLLDALDGDSLSGLGGVDYMVQLVIGGEDADPALDQYASKTLEVDPRIPAARQANKNPGLERIEATIDGGAPTVMSNGRCIDAAPTLTVKPRDLVRLTPIEKADARETYVVPTLDGTSRMFTESLTYQWVASAGGFSSGSTGGPHDIAGNPAPLFSDWRAPSAEDLDGPTDISLWIIQRDERLGVTPYQSCVRVVP